MQHRPQLREPQGEQSSNHIIMVWSPGFRSNVETQGTNFAQAGDEGVDLDQLLEKARAEFDGLKDELEALGVRVTVQEGPAGSPDALFPNNTFSSHSDVGEDGNQVSTVVFYPMLADNRQAELTDERQAELAAQHDQVVDLRGRRSAGQILEGTGSLVLDRQNKIAYAVRSPRTDEDLVKEWAEELGYEPVIFDAVHADGNAVYHTNVVMWVGTQAAGICLEAIPDEAERAMVRKKLEDSGKVVIDISQAQMDAPNFSGNALEVLNGDGEPVLAMSEAAWNGYTRDQQALLNLIYPAGIVKAAIPTIERFGGGSVRCMMAEEFNACSGSEDMPFVGEPKTDAEPDAPGADL